MAKELAPAFQYYPKDFLSDPNVVLMDAEAVGAYWLLCSYCWLEGSLPMEAESLRVLARVKPARWEHVWRSGAPCFSVGEEDGRIYHGRLDRERRSQAERRQRRRNAAERRWADRQLCHADAMHRHEPASDDALQCSSSPSPSPSPSSSPTPVRTTAAAPPGFDDFWDSYPRKIGKDAAKKAWAKKRPPLGDV